MIWRFAFPIAAAGLASIAFASWVGCGNDTGSSNEDGGSRGGGPSDGAPGSRDTDGGSGSGPDGSCADPTAASTSDLLDRCGVVDPVAYRAMAPALGNAAGIAYRYGPPCSEADAGALPTWAHPADQHYDNMGNGAGWEWQVGGPEASKTDQGLNDYASNQGQGIYVADGAGDAGDPGVVDLIPYTMSENTFAESPQLPWVYYGGGNPDVNLVDYQKARTTPLAGPTAIGRCYGNFGWCSNALVAFPDGTLVTTGSNTARNENVFQLPAGKIPTAIAVTNSSEFALVTVWDVQNLKGQVAVFALAGTCDGCEPGGKSAPYNWWGEWAEVYPGLRNLGDIGFIKLLGFVDLPGMMAPIEISASADYIPNLDDQQGWMCTPDGSSCRTQPHDLTLSNETNRQSFVAGPNAKRYSKSGFAVVISKSERKAIFLDLKPLFAEVQTMYFGTPANFALTQNLGQADSQWPYAFTNTPAFAPVVVKTVTLSQPPTSVKTSLQDVDRAWIGTADGTLHVFDVGGYGNNMPATADVIAEVGTVAVGKNPTWIAYAKHDWANPIQKTTSTIDHEVIVVSRGDCRIDWVTLAPDNNGGAITRTLQDSRLVDPISAEDNDNHGTESYLLTVADYGGRQIAQYRYGPVIFHTNPGQAGNSVAAACQPPAGCPTGSNGMDAFEFGGAYPVMGKPFRFTSANTP
jgi:hypothetical protein